jgi:transcription elongation factor GreB
MSKAFTKESTTEEDSLFEESEIPSAFQGVKNYITLEGYKRLLNELTTLVKQERPKVVDAVHWAAKNGDRSENGDYIYGKKRLREIDRRIRFLNKRIESAVQVDSSAHFGSDRVYFGASVMYRTQDAGEHRVTIVGLDEADNGKGEVSWVSPISKALIGSYVGDSVSMQTPNGSVLIEIIDVEYPDPA